MSQPRSIRPRPAASRQTLREEQRDLTRKRIIDAARTCFYDIGVSETPVEQIANAAGVSRATLYLHFPNKDAILLELLSANLKGVRAIFARLNKMAPLDEDKAHDWFSEYVDALRAHQKDMRLFHVGVASDDVAREMIDDHREAILDILGDAYPSLSRDAPNWKVRHAQAVLTLARIDHAGAALAEDKPRIDAAAATDIIVCELTDLLNM